MFISPWIHECGMRIHNPSITLLWQHCVLCKAGKHTSIFIMNMCYLLPSCVCSPKGVISSQMKAQHFALDCWKWHVRNFQSTFQLHVMTRIWLLYRIFSLEGETAIVSLHRVCKHAQSSGVWGHAPPGDLQPLRLCLVVPETKHVFRSKSNFTYILVYPIS